MKGIVGDIIAVILLGALLLLAPQFNIGVEQWAESKMMVLSEARNLIDEVIDDRTLSDDTLEDFNLAVASASEYFKVDIIRKTKVVNPDPKNPGRTYTTYVLVDDIRNWKQGDRIVVKIHTIGQNIGKTIAASILGYSINDTDVEVGGRVR